MKVPGVDSDLEGGGEFHIVEDTFRDGGYRGDQNLVIGQEGVGGNLVAFYVLLTSVNVGQ